MEIKDKLNSNLALLSEIVDSVISLRNNKNSDNLPLLPEELSILSNNLHKSDFTLVVSGEVNRGKSTFINAIIGQNILPTFDKETTSQVFKIINSKEESYIIVYENGDRVKINKEDLSAYGTQLGKSSDLSIGKRIVFIEIKVPIKNLPSGVTIVDTPGIGSTFKEHTEIAREFMRQADAVIYLCSSKHPIVKVDIDFVKNTILPLPAIPNVLFVMAKADQADSVEALGNLIQRSENQLKENFPDNPSIGKKVIPIDSLSLIDSNNADSTEVSELLRQTSNFEAVNQSINELIDRQKFFWLVTTYNCIAKYYKRVSQFLTKQISEYDLDSQKRQDKLDSITNNIINLERDLGLSKQRDVLEKVNNILISFKSDIKSEFNSEKSSLLSKYNIKIESLSSKLSSDDVNENAKLYSSQLLEDATDKWDELCSTAISEIQTVLAIYHKECQLKVDEAIELPSIDDSNFSVNMDVTVSDKIDAMRGKYFTAVFGTTVGVFALQALAASSSTVAAIVGSSAFLGPAGWIIGGGTILYGLFYGNKKAKEKAFLKAKTEIKNHLKEILAEIYNQLSKTSLMDGKHESALRLFEKSLQDSSMDTVTNIYSRAKSELESARRSLVDSNIIDNRVKVVNQQKLWNGVAKKMQSITSTIKEMNVYYKVF
jgi:GTPase Era involved in 16S rRNA processing